MHLYKVGDAPFCIIRTTLLVLFSVVLSVHSHAQCDLKIFQNGTLSNGAVTLFPQIIGDLTCKKVQHCDQNRKLISWSMNDCEDCTGQLSTIECHLDDALKRTEENKSDQEKIACAVSTESNSKAVALKDGSETIFVVSVQANSTDYLSLTSLAYNAKLLQTNGELVCTEEKPIAATLTSYLMTFKIDNKIVFSEERSIEADWQHKKINLSSVNRNSGIHVIEPTRIEVSFKLNSTKGNSYLIIDELDITGKSCVKETEVNYTWSTGETSETIQFEKAGDYCVTITDCNGCIATDCISMD